MSQAVSQSDSIAPASSSGSAAGVLFAGSILLSAFLLFAVQPLIARFILPWFGGAAAVWTTCLLFFQAVLLAGYAYAHVLADRLKPRTQAIVHIALLLVCLVLLPISPSPRFAPANSDYPTLRVLLVLAASVGLPYFALAATSPLVQHWFAGVYPARSVYRLYALSNVGSLAALVSYPFVIEPVLSRRAQSSGWSWLFALFAFACAGCAVVAARRRRVSNNQTLKTDDTSAQPLTGRAKILVLLLTALASAFLLSTTNKICQEIAPFPFLWVLPLTLYLIAFILCFEYPQHYRRAIFIPAAAIATAGAAYVLGWRWTIPLYLQLIAFCSVLFFCCVFCLGETVRLRPAARYLTQYYLLVSLGGVIGALLVTLVAPSVFSRFLELHVCIMAAWLLGMGVLLVDPTSPMRDFRRPLLWLIAVLAMPSVGMMLLFDAMLMTTNRILARRNFYGVLEVEEVHDDDPRHAYRELVHSGTTHGMQFLHPELRRQPTSYYDPKSGVGLVMTRRNANRPRKIGLVGLGAGTLATYGRAGDNFTFYELDPEVIEVAKSHFTFLADCPAGIHIIQGDARLSLARQENQGYDILVLDAFSGDAVPVHLLTMEAFFLYGRHLAPGGVIAVHLSNRHLRLLPAVWASSKRWYDGALFETDIKETPYPSTWLLLSRDRAFLEASRAWPTFSGGSENPIPPWTDDHAPLFPIMR